MHLSGSNFFGRFFANEALDFSFAVDYQKFLKWFSFTSKFFVQNGINLRLIDQAEPKNDLSCKFSTKQIKLFFSGILR